MIVINIIVPYIHDDGDDDDDDDDDDDGDGKDDDDTDDNGYDDDDGYVGDVNLDFNHVQCIITYEVAVVDHQSSSSYK